MGGRLAGRSWRRRAAGLALGSLAAAAAVTGLTNGVAGAGYPACGGSQVFDVAGGTGVELYDVSGYDVRNYDLGFSLAPGRYDIETSSFDGYPGRKDVPLAQQEKSERWWAEFLDADGNVVGALPGPTTDLPDDVDSAEVLDSFDAVQLTGTATAVRLVLIKDFLSLNLVHVGCLGFQRLVDPTTTTVAPATTTTQPAVSTSAPASTTTVATGSKLPATGTDAAPYAVAGVGAVMLGLVALRSSARMRQRMNRS